MLKKELFDNLVERVLEDDEFKRFTPFLRNYYDYFYDIYDESDKELAEEIVGNFFYRLVYKKSHNKELTTEQLQKIKQMIEGEDVPVIVNWATELADECNNETFLRAYIYDCLWAMFQSVDVAKGKDIQEQIYFGLILFFQELAVLISFHLQELINEVIQNGL